MMTGGGDGLSTFASGICKPSDENSENTQPGMLQQSEARHFIQGYLHFHAADEQRSSHLVQVTSQYYSTTQSFCKDIAEKKSTSWLLRCAQFGHSKSRIVLHTGGAGTRTQSLPQN